MKIAIIGSGISGLTAAWLLHQSHEITVFEANDYIGGHTHTIDVDVDGDQLAIDTGFIVYNDWTYPNFIQMLERLGVGSLATEMSFSVRCERSRIEYSGSNLNGLFAQRSNLLRPRFHRMLQDILRFNREALELLEADHDSLTVDEYIAQRGYSKQFSDLYLIPMGAAIWSCPPETFGKFPVRFIVEFYRNHGLLSIRNRPQWRVISGGSQQYVDKLIAPFRGRIRLNSPVQSIVREETAVTIRATGSEDERFDHAILACHSDQALRILGDTATMIERSVLNEFPYQMNSAFLHCDDSVLPQRRRAWASWNYHIDGSTSRQNEASKETSSQSATVTYNMNILQRLKTERTYCVTLNRDAAIDPAKVIGRYEYHHPVYTTERRAAQQKHPDLINHNRTSFCGAYWGNGFHEDGVNSALPCADNSEWSRRGASKFRPSQKLPVRRLCPTSSLHARRERVYLFGVVAVPRPERT
jgi:predicted NAD/FAD-binding protein